MGGGQRNGAERNDGAGVVIGVGGRQWSGDNLLSIRMTRRVGKRCDTVGFSETKKIFQKKILSR